jgi:hypothetical protein
MIEESATCIEEQSWLPPLLIEKTMQGSRFPAMHFALCSPYR